MLCTIIDSTADVYISEENLFVKEQTYIRTIRIIIYIYIYRIIYYVVHKVLFDDL